MSHSADDEARERFQSFMDQIDLFRKDLESASANIQSDVVKARAAVELVRRRAEYVLEEYF